MLVLTRRPNERIVIDGCIAVTVITIEGNKVRLGIEAPRDVAIWREELCGETKETTDLAFARSDCSPPM
jgi:carbon storage regulator